MPNHFFKPILGPAFTPVHCLDNKKLPANSPASNGSLLIHSKIPYIRPCVPPRTPNVA
jgi:hypothetical protein